MQLSLSTPPGTPAPAAAQRRSPSLLLRLQAKVQLVASAWLERQDRMGVATLGFYLSSALSTTAAVALSLQFLPFDVTLWNSAGWFLRHFSGALGAIPIALGLASERRLPRALAWYSIGLGSIYYGWGWLPGDGSPDPLIKVAYILPGLVVVLPALLAQLARRKRESDRISD